VHQDEILVGIVGRLTEIKNHEFFLRAVAEFKQYHQQNPLQRVRFLIIGDGSLRQKLEEQVRDLGLSADVMFAGNRTDPENFYPALDLVALTSKNEGTPLTLIEAMANERPIVSTAVGGVVDLIGQPETFTSATSYSIGPRGISASGNDARGFAMALARLVSDEPLRRSLGKAGLQFVEQNHSKQRLLDDVSKLYEQLVPGDQTAAVQTKPTTGSVGSRA
jgi:glycosyltransferase involved in cell wall biosynthesis